ncbi:hypothetical protein ACP70R_007246 [Stipagrostis hirtigluma subsp. patula]
MAEVEATNDDEDASNAAEDVIVLCSDRNASENARNQSMSKVSEDEAHAISLVSEEELSCYDEGDSADFDCSAEILPDSSHRDGSIYKSTYKWQRDYRIADRNEKSYLVSKNLTLASDIHTQLTGLFVKDGKSDSMRSCGLAARGYEVKLPRLEAMMLSEPKDCMMHNGICLWHSPTHMMQIFSIKLAKTPVDSGPVELYGYIAMRDRLDPLSNFVINLSRDDPMIIEQGSLIEMTGPKRGIDFFDTILIEYDMRIKQGEQEKDDLQLIDGATAMDELTLQTRHVFTQRIHGDCGAIDISLSRLVGAVEATVEVVISEVQCAIDLCLSCFASGLNEEIRLFHGAIGEPRALRRSVVAVVMDSWMHLKFKVGSVDHSGYVEPCCSFKPTNHGCSRQEIRSKFTSMSVKVTWSTLDLRGE